METKAEMRIGELARLTGVPERRIRFYESRGLVEPAARSEAGYRLYGEEEVARLEFVKRAKLLGMTLEEIRGLVSLAAKCGRGGIVLRLEGVLDGKLRETEEKIAELKSFRKSLLYYRERATALEEGRLPNPCETDGFCRCLDAVTREEVIMDTIANAAPCDCGCACCETSSCDCGCECCKDCA